MGKPETLDAIAPSTVDKAELVRRLSHGAAARVPAARGART